MKKSLLAAAALMSLFLAACNKEEAVPAASTAASEVSAPAVASEPVVPASEPVVAPTTEVSAPAVASEAKAEASAAAASK
ncbi:hypothetical protein SALWKB12_1245 [Snodgrassella communis]|nr:hypothetical protein [Snodgrassella communis]KDN12721.1 hypothetical protein SALWKB12_1245 [Snodgrassella communis]